MDRPQIRLGATNRAISAQIIDGDHRIYVMNANGPQDARSVLGRLNRPWEAQPATMIVGADRQNVDGLLEAILRTEPRQVLVAGSPGADADWAVIDRYSREHDLQIKYLDAPATIELSELTISIVPQVKNGSRHSPSFVEVSTGELHMAIGLGGSPASGRYHLIVSDDAIKTSGWADFRIAASAGSVIEDRNTLLLEPGERIDAIIDETKIRIHGRAAAEFSQP